MSWIYTWTYVHALHYINTYAQYLQVWQRLKPSHGCSHLKLELSDSMAGLRPAHDFLYVLACVYVGIHTVCMCVLTSQYWTARFRGWIMTCTWFDSIWGSSANVLGKYCKPCVLCGVHIYIHTSMLAYKIICIWHFDIFVACSFRHTTGQTAHVYICTFYTCA